MDYLIDTHTLLWYFKGDELLSKTAKEIIDSVDEKKFISIASLWEMAVKLNIEKLKIDYPFSEIEKKINARHITILGINFQHTEQIIKLPLHHRDPFDRMIIAQSIIEDLTVISKDKNFTLYPIKLLW